MYKDSKRGKQWYDCNDSWVKAISSPDLKSTSAYVLFYELSTSPTPY
jgi:ubiquitin C-terminal hydrolase